MPLERRERVFENRPRRRRYGRGKRKKSFSTFISRILKLTDPFLGITGKSMKVMNSLIIDTYDRLMAEAMTLHRAYGRSNVLNSRDMQGATRLVFRGELAKNALTEGSKAVTKYFSHQKGLALGK